MSSSLFSENNPVIHCAPKRVRRRWGRKVLALVLAALVVWLLSGCSSSAKASEDKLPKWLSGSVLGLECFASLLLIVWAARKLRENDRFCADLHKKQVQRKQRTLQLRREFCERADSPHDVPAFTPQEKHSEGGRVFVRRFAPPPPVILGTPEAVKAPAADDKRFHYVGTLPAWADDPFIEAGTSASAPIPAEDLREIYGSLVVTVCEAREMVRKAQGNLAVDDYGDKLAGAEHKLTRAISRLGGLLERGTGPAQAGTPNPKEDAA